MNNFIGRKWGALTDEERKNLLMIGNVYDNVKEGDCIVDFGEDLSITGKVIKEFKDEYGQLIIDDDAVFYNPLG